MIAANTVVHTVCSEQMSGKVFSALEFVIHAAFLLAMLASAYAAEYVSRVWILSVVGVIFLVIGIIGLITYKDD